MDYKPGTPPPVHHVLRPHHIDLIAIFLLVFKEFHNNLPPDFSLFIYRFLLLEVSEVTQPRTHEQILLSLKSSPDTDHPNVRNLLMALEAVPSQLTSADQLTNFFHSTPNIFIEKAEDEPNILARRSIFGYFCRRCFVSFIKLSFYGVMQLQKDYQAWCAGDQVDYGPVEKDPLTEDIWIFKTMSDLKSSVRSEPWELWEEGRSKGDDVIGPENLRRYFEQRFHDHSDSGVRQHALLNLVRMHYVRKEYPAACQLLQEAIAVARTCGDRVTLQHCISMLHRLPPNLSANDMPLLNEFQPDLHPCEVLFDVTKLLQPQNGQPLTLCFERLAQAIGLYDHWVDLKKVASCERELLGPHVMQAVLWSTLGCHDLAVVEESFVLAFAKALDSDPNRLNVVLNRAYRLARAGSYQIALALLLHSDTWRGLSLDQYQEWAIMIWHIMALRSSRRNQRRFFRDFLLPRQPTSSTFVSKEYFFDGDSVAQLAPIGSELYQVMDARRRGQAVTAIQPLLQSLWHAEFQGRFPLHRVGTILLADIGLEFGLTKHCRRLVEGIMPQVLTGHELEHRAFACYTLARCIIAVSDSKEAGLREALPHLLMAEADYGRLEMLEATADVQWLLTVTFRGLRMAEKEKAVFERYSNTISMMQGSEECALDEEAQQVWEFVTDVGLSIGCAK